MPDGAPWSFIVGLGNPGRRYANTRHNVGFRVVEAVAERLGVRLRRRWLVRARTAEVDWRDRRLALVEPLTYMNRNGDTVAGLMAKRGAEAGSLLVICDDMSLPLAKLRIRARGSPGGHNGLKSLSAALGTDAFARLRFGIGSPPDGSDWIGHVLGPFSTDEEELLEPSIRRAADAVLEWAEKGADAVMNRYNSGMNAGGEA
jgi:PTH1 family peptidyl-tRNA hydrolase